MAEEDGVAVDQVRLDRFGIQPTLHRVGREDHDQICLLAGLEGREDAEPLLLGGGPAL
jgi:hypothetical protein